MHNDRRAHYFLLLCLAASLFVVFLVVQPFIGALIVAAVLAFLFQPVYQRVLRATKRRASLAAFLTTIIALLSVLLPLVLLGTLILQEATSLYHAIAGTDSDGFLVQAEGILEGLRSVVPIPQNFELNIGQYARQGLGLLVQNLGAIFSSAAQLLLNTFVFLTAFYFFLKDGSKLKDYMVALSPLADRDDLMIVSRLAGAVNSAVKGNLTIGLIQGAVTGVGFAIFGVPNPVLWGSVTAIAALVPGIGTALVLTPAIIYLFLTGSATAGFGLLVWGVAAVGMVDNVLGPRLIGRGMKLHPLAVFLSVLGGIILFGPLGFLLGPLAMSLCFALMEIYTALQDKDSPAYR